ncbi:MAG: hypothetical protein MSA49_04470 [Clostridia bacterium]|nr:hypothetical protein [Clostridia bacterium]
MNPNDTKNTVGTDISASPPLWKKILNTVFFHTCAYFTVFTLILLIIQASAGDSNTAYVKPSRFLLVLPFALFIALADVLFLLPKLQKAVALLFHCLITMLGFFFFMYLPVSGSIQMLPILLLALILYGIVMTVCMIPTIVRGKRAKKDAVYTSVFSANASSEKKPKR